MTFDAALPLLGSSRRAVSDDLPERRVELVHDERNAVGIDDRAHARDEALVLQRLQQVDLALQRGAHLRALAGVDAAPRVVSSNDARRCAS